jgi:hypothetical protein
VKPPAVSALPVPDERRPALASAAVVTAAGIVVTGATVMSWSTRESRAVVALVVAIAAVAAGCAALAGYLLWLRRSVTVRMVSLLRPYLRPASPAGTAPTGTVAAGRLVAARAS